MAWFNFIVNPISVVGTVSGNGCDWTVNLIKQIWHRGDVANIILRKFHGGNLVASGVNREMKLPPMAAGSFPVLFFQPVALAVDLETGAIDQKM